MAAVEEVQAVEGSAGAREAGWEEEKEEDLEVVRVEDLVAELEEGKKAEVIEQAADLE